VKWLAQGYINDEKQGPLSGTPNVEVLPLFASINRLAHLAHYLRGDRHDQPGGPSPPIVLHQRQQRTLVQRTAHRLRTALRGTLAAKRGKLAALSRSLHHLEPRLYLQAELRARRSRPADEIQRDAREARELAAALMASSDLIESRSGPRIVSPSLRASFNELRQKIADGKFGASAASRQASMCSTPGSATVKTCGLRLRGSSARIRQDPTENQIEPRSLSRGHRASQPLPLAEALRHRPDSP
jgi:hypothetical protein